MSEQLDNIYYIIKRRRKDKSFSNFFLVLLYSTRFLHIFSSRSISIEKRQTKDNRLFCTYPYSSFPDSFLLIFLILKEKILYYIVHIIILYNIFFFCSFSEIPFTSSFHHAKPQHTTIMQNNAEYN